MELFDGLFEGVWGSHGSRVWDFGCSGENFVDDGAFPDDSVTLQEVFYFFLVLFKGLFGGLLGFLNNWLVFVRRQLGLQLLQVH